MKNLFTLLLVVSSVPFLSNAQNVGVDVAVPAQKLDVAGGIKIGNTSNGVAGSLRWDGTNIQYHDGTSWINLIANTDDQTLSIALNILTIEDGNTVDLTPYLDNTDAQTLSLAGTDLTITTGNTVDLGPLQRQLIDADSDTKVQVEESADEDIIRFDVAGNERWVMRGSRLENSGTGSSVFVGKNSGVGDDLSNRRNTALGEDALRINTSGVGNTAVGYQALESTTTSYSTAFGHNTLLQATGIRNTAFGTQAGQNLTIGTDNAFFGGFSGSGFVSGSQNTMLGNYAGFNSIGGGSRNVFIGYRAGYNETGSDKLYIDNSDIATPLIYGDFATNTLQVNGTLNVNGAYDLPTADGAAAGYVMTTDAAGTVSWTDPGLTGDITSIIAGDGLTTPDGSSGDVTIHANPDNVTIEVVADALQVKADGITATHIATDAVGSAEIATDAVGAAEIAAGAVGSSEIADNTVAAIDIATGAVTTDEILNATILPEDVDPSAGSANNVLSIVGGVAAWVDPATVNTTLQDTDADTKIEVEAAPDEDYIRMSTAGNEVITVDPAGNVGVGMTTPTRPVHVAGTTGGQILVSRDDATVTVGETLGEILFDAEDDNPSTVDASAVIRAISAEPTTYGNSDKGGNLTFLTKANATDENAAASEHMRITQAGRVGIGTVSPAAKLHTAGGQILATNGSSSNTRSMTILNDGTGQINFGSYPGAWTSALQIQNNDNTDYIWLSPLQQGNNARLVTSGSGLDFHVGANAFAATLTEAGNLGVGTTGPAQKLEVAGVTRSTLGLEVNSGSVATNNNYGIYFNGSADRSYAMYRESGAWTSPYPDMMLRFHTGIKISAEGSYGGVKIYANNGESLTASFDNSGITVANLAGSGSRAVYADASGTLNTTAPTSGVNGYWSRSGNDLTTSTAGDDVIIDQSASLYVGPSARFYSDASYLRYDGPRPFYVTDATPTTYLYSANTYLGSTTGDVIRMRGNNLIWNEGIIEGSGNVGIGTTSPFDKVNISGRIRFGTNAVSYQNAGTGATYGTGDPTQGIGWGNQSLDEYGIYVAPQENVYGNYTRLILGWHTGVKIGASSSYGGTRFYNNSPRYGGSNATEIMSIGSGDNHVRVNNYLFAQYLNSTDNSIGSGVTGIMAKAGDNYFRTANAAAIATFLNTTGTWIPNNGIGDWQIASSSTGTGYGQASLELRESNFTGNGSATPPHLGFHWGGVVASNIAIESSGRIAIRDNPGTGYENFIAREVYATGDLHYGSNNSRTQTKSNAGAIGSAKSGFYETSAPSPASSWYPGASSWQHLLDVRHSNTGNNYALQIAGSFFDQELYYRKTNNSASTAWTKVAKSTDVMTTFVHWGRNDCPPSSSVSIVYAGWAGGGNYGHSGSGANTLCMSSAPTWTGASYHDGNQNGGLIYGTEFQGSGYGVLNYGGLSSAALQDWNAKCATCLVTGDAVSMMVPGTVACPAGWARQYWGYLMSSHYTQTKSEFVCVANNPGQYAPHGGDQNGNLWYPVEFEGGSGNGNGYTHDREITCAVCTR